MESVTKEEGYDSSAKHRYVIDNKKLAKIKKNGILTPKGNGEVNIQVEQKVKGGSWTKIGNPVHLYIQKPQMERKVQQSAEAGANLDAFKYLSKTTYRPTKWISSKPSVATIDENGVITVLKKGSTKIIAQYGEGKNSSKNKYATKLKLN